MSADHIFDQLIARIQHLERVVERQAVRMNNMIREGKVTDVNYEKGLAIVDAHGIPSKPSPWLQHAGSIVDWEPPAVGQRVVLFSPSGDLGRGFILPGGYTEQTPQPYARGAMFSRTIGGTKITGDGSSYRVETETIVLKANVVIEGNVTITGSELTHNGKNVGSTHVHSGIIRGVADTNPPH